MSVVGAGVGLAAAGRPRALFVCGSLNQTTQLHAVARELRDFDVSFTPFYGDFWVTALRRLGWVEMTIGGNRRRGWCLQYLRDHKLAIDLDGVSGPYDLVVTCSDLTVPRNVRGARLVLVQEGILDPDGLAAKLCRRFPALPRFLAGTALTGESFLYDRFCVASPGYRDRMIRLGVDAAKVVVTGIPNFDDCRVYEDNDFPHHRFVLVCTSDARETFKRDNRRRLVERALAIADGRLLIFKLHPNENVDRATSEIKAVAPEALVFSQGSAEEMIANCDVLLTQWSSTVFVGMALGKEVHSNFALDELRRLAPIQNGGMAASNIAAVCRELLGAGRTPMPRRSRREPPPSQEAARP
jgi:hypothetical protein